MVRKIDDDVGSHPCDGMLEALNSATCDNHLGDDAYLMIKKDVDPDALKVIVTDAMELIGARRPAGSTAGAA